MNASKPEPLAGAMERIHQTGKVRVAIAHLDTPTPGAVIVGTYRSDQEVWQA